jgi:hypothetical protein
MKLNITIDCSNAAFGDTDAERHAELATILARLAASIEAGHVPEKLRDSNGNTVGTVTVTE